MKYNKTRLNDSTAYGYSCPRWKIVFSRARSWPWIGRRQVDICSEMRARERSIFASSLSWALSASAVSLAAFLPAVVCTCGE